MSRSEHSARRFAPWDYAAFGALTIIQVLVLGRALGRSAAGLAAGEHSLILGALLATIVLEVLIWEWRWVSLPLMRIPERRPAREGWRVAAAITFVPGVESVAMLEETLRAVVAMRYPHESWVLDEGDAPSVRELCRSHGARYFTRQHDSRYQAQRGPFASRTKYGNYNAWLDAHGNAAYDLVVAFDSDHIPRPDYLDEVLGYFDDDRVAYVQPAQAYYNQDASFIARAAAEETYAYYSSIQMSGYGVGHPVVVGCHNTHRVTALRSIGGFAAHEADDMVMTLRYRAAGWRGVYVPRILARGLAPVDWGGYLRQQRRWARSVLDLTMRVFPALAKGLPLVERLTGYLPGLYYLRGVIIAVQLAIVAYVLVGGLAPQGSSRDIAATMAAVVLCVLSCELYRQRFFLDPRREWGIHWRAGFVGYAKWPWLVLAFADAVRGRYGAYTTTSKSMAAPPARALAIVHATLCAVIALAWAVAMWRRPFTSIPLHLAAAIVVVLSLLVAASVTIRFPPPFDLALRRRSWDERSAGGRSVGPAPAEAAGSGIG